jgi:hypothetical protein
MFIYHCTCYLTDRVEGTVNDPKNNWRKIYLKEVTHTTIMSCLVEPSLATIDGPKFGAGRSSPIHPLIKLICS